jgi:hypothetical protein
LPGSITHNSLTAAEPPLTSNLSTPLDAASDTYFAEDLFTAGWAIGVHFGRSSSDTIVS